MYRRLILVPGVDFEVYLAVSEQRLFKRLWFSFLDRVGENLESFGALSLQKENS